MGLRRWQHDAYYYGPHQFSNGTGEDTPVAVVMGSGSSTYPVLSSDLTKNFMEFRFKHTGASGDIRGMYLRLYHAGGAGGEAARIFTTTQAACGTVHGAHISLNFTDETTVPSGQGIAMRATLHIPDGAIAAGTYAAVQAEAYCDGASGDIPADSHGLIRAIVAGNGTADDNVTNLLLVTCPAGNMAAKLMQSNADVTGGGGAAGGGLQVVVNGTHYWIPLYAIA